MRTYGRVHYTPGSYFLWTYVLPAIAFVVIGPFLWLYNVIVTVPQQKQQAQKQAVYQQTVVYNGLSGITLGMTKSDVLFKLGQPTFKGHASFVYETYLKRYTAVYFDPKTNKVYEIENSDTSENGRTGEAIIARWGLPISTVDVDGNTFQRRYFYPQHQTYYILEKDAVVAMGVYVPLANEISMTQSSTFNVDAYLANKISKQHTSKILKVGEKYQKNGWTVKRIK